MDSATAQNYNCVVIWHTTHRQFCILDTVAYFPGTCKDPGHSTSLFGKWSSETMCLAGLSLFPLAYDVPQAFQYNTTICIFHSKKTLKNKGRAQCNRWKWRTTGDAEDVERNRATGGKSSHVTNFLNLNVPWCAFKMHKNFTLWGTKHQCIY